MAIMFEGHNLSEGTEVYLHNADLHVTITKLVLSEDDEDYKKAKEVHKAKFGFDFEDGCDGGSILGSEPGPVYLIEDDEEDITPAYESEFTGGV